MPCVVQDGALSNKELNAFQTKCFSAPLQPEELVGIKKVVKDRVPNVSLPFAFSDKFVV